VPPHSHLTSCTPTNIYLSSSLETDIREPVLYRLLTFQNPNLISIFCRLSRLSKESIQVRGTISFFVTNLFFYGEELLAPHPTPKLEYHPFSFIRSCLFNIFTATLHNWRQFLPSQPEDTPYCGEKKIYIYIYIYIHSYPPQLEAVPPFVI
jgi:hypothetical protein